MGPELQSQNRVDVCSGKKIGLGTFDDNFSFFNSFQGSDEFVKRFLLPDILRKYDQSDIGGTFIVDTLMNLNLTENRSSSCHPIRRNHKPMKRGDYVIFSMQTLSM